MSEINNDTKYWIKSGCMAEHINYPGVTIIVDYIVTEKKMIDDGNGGKKEKIFTVGWQCHWVTKEGRYQKGLLNTCELAKPLSLSNCLGSTPPLTKFKAT